MYIKKKSFKKNISEQEKMDNIVFSLSRIVLGSRLPSPKKGDGSIERKVIKLRPLAYRQPLPHLNFDLLSRLNAIIFRASPARSRVLPKSIIYITRVGLPFTTKNWNLSSLIWLITRWTLGPPEGSHRIFPPTRNRCRFLGKTSFPTHTHTHTGLYIHKLLICYCYIRSGMILENLARNVNKLKSTFHVSFCHMYFNFGW